RQTGEARGSKEAARTRPLACSELLLDRTDVRRLGALLALCDVELDGLTLGQRAVALAEDPGVVDEYVVPVLTGDKAEAFLVAEPLNGSAQWCSSFLCDAWSTALLVQPAFAGCEL